jgi:hypothetical protein
MRDLTYESLERLRVQRPVDRLSYVSSLCQESVVLDIGGLDETALVKRQTEHWLHGRLGATAKQVIGIDSAACIPPGGLKTGANSMIFRGDGTDPNLTEDQSHSIDKIVAGEFLEHLENPLTFLRNIKRRFVGKEMIITTPNGAGFANTFLGLFGREAQHPDHTQVYTYKILNTLCVRAGFSSWEILPYRFAASEMILQSRGIKRWLAIIVQAGIRLVERAFPLLSFGYVLRVRV